MEKSMHDKKQNIIKSPDHTKLQEVIIDIRTKIYIPIGENPEEARNRYLARSITRKP